MNSFVSGIQFIMRGGFMMYPLLISAIVALTVIVERYYLFQRKFSSTKGLVTSVVKLLRENKIDKAREMIGEGVNPAASVLRAGVENFRNSTAELELSMSNEAESWIPVLEKRIEVVDTVITAAPLMGLLGTITGMMGSFQVLSEKGVNEPHAITGGVAEALIATATGLVIALVCLMAYNHLSSWIKKFIYDMEAAASRIQEAHVVVLRKNGSASA